MDWRKVGRVDSAIWESRDWEDFVGCGMNGVALWRMTVCEFEETRRVGVARVVPFVCV